MKSKVLILVILFVAFACTPDEPRFIHELLPIENYEVPTTFVSGETYDIHVEYRRPTDCHGFDGFYYDSFFSTRTIAIIAIVDQTRPCIDLDEDTPLSNASFQFKVLQHPGSSYLFRFFKGKDPNGENVFDEVLIPVED